MKSRKKGVSENQDNWQLPVDEQFSYGRADSERKGQYAGEIGVKHAPKTIDVEEAASGRIRKPFKLRLKGLWRRLRMWTI